VNIRGAVGSKFQHRFYASVRCCIL